MTAQRDLNRILSAWDNEGPRPQWHRMVKAWVRKNWPTLYDAIEEAKR